jgi:hypothetical protein
MDPICSRRQEGIPVIGDTKVFFAFEKKSDSAVTFDPGLQDQQ